MTSAHRPVDAAILHDAWRRACREVTVGHAIVELDGTVLLDAHVGATTGSTAFSGASMIKTFLAELVTADVAAGRRDWDDPVEVTGDHAVSEDGVLNEWRLPATLALANVQQLMIGISDNTATNTITDLLGGVAVVNDRLAAAGYASRIRRHVGRLDEPAIDDVPDPRFCAPPGFSIVHPAEHLASLRRGLADPVTTGHFRSQSDRGGLARRLAEEVWLAHKTGSVTGVRHDAGVLRHDGHELAISVFTDSTDGIETVDHPGCLAADAGMRATLELLGWNELIVG